MKQPMIGTMFETDKVLTPDPVIEWYKKRVDRAASRENLKLSFEQRLAKLEGLQKRAIEEALEGKNRSTTTD